MLALVQLHVPKRELHAVSHQEELRSMWASLAACMGADKLPATCIWIINGEAIALGHVSSRSTLARGIGWVVARSRGGP